MLEVTPGNLFEKIPKYVFVDAPRKFEWVVLLVHGMLNQLMVSQTLTWCGIFHRGRVSHHLVSAASFLVFVIS